MRWTRRTALAAVILAALLGGCGTSSPAPSPSARASATGTVPPRPQPASGPTGSATPRASASPSPSAPSALPVAPGAGALPQTHAFPSTSSVAFRNAMTDLWLAVTTGSPRLGLPAFFPEAAYEKLKAIPYPAPDWQFRLWYDFGLDVRAAHDLLGRGARLIRSGRFLA